MADKTITYTIKLEGMEEAKNALEAMKKAFANVQGVGAKAMGGGTPKSTANEQIRENDRVLREQQRMTRAMDVSRVNFFKNMTFQMQPLFNPTSIWGQMFAARQGFSSFASPFGQSLIGGGGTTAAIGATAGLQLGLTALGIAIKGLSATMNKAIESIKFSAQMYAKSTSSGLGTGFVIRRTLAAQVLGVSEQEIFQFGAALAYINPKIQDAVNILTSVNNPLAKIRIDFEILKVQFMALGASIANNLSKQIDDFIKAMTAFTSSDVLKGVLEGVSTVLMKFVQIIAMLGTTVFASMQLIADGIAVVIRVISGQFKMMGPQVDVLKKHFWSSGASLDAQFKALMGTGGAAGRLPEPQSFMKQLPVSSWEKMGLVIGGGGQNNWAKDTAKNTGKMVSLMEKIAHAGMLPREHGSPMVSPAYNMA